MFHFIPKSSATTCGRRESDGASKAVSPPAGCSPAVAGERNERSRPSSHELVSLGITS